MNKVITINLGGNAYQLEEGAYDALRRYLDQAAVALSANPDKDEIIGDLEQAIGGKCAACLSQVKTVVTTKDIEQIVEDMGPVRGEDEGDEKKTHGVGAQPTYKRLYRLHEGRVIAGVCTGLAAYFNIDVVLVRLLFIVLTMITGGGFILVYLLMAVFVPEALTTGEQASAYGTTPITAQELIDRAREGYDHFKNSREWHQWKRQMKEQTREWKRQFKAEKHQWRYDQKSAYSGYHYHRSPISELVHAVFGMLWLLFMLFIAWTIYHHVPLAHEFLDALAGWINTGIDAAYQIFTR